MLRAALRAITLLSLLPCLSLVARANTLRVPADQPSIGAALTVAADGDTILLADGVYSEGPIQGINKGVTLQSESGNPAACILYQTMLSFEMYDNQSHAITLRDLTLRNDLDSALSLANAGFDPTLPGYLLTASNCVFDDSLYGGIFVLDSSAALILTDCTFKNIVAAGGYMKSFLASDCAVTNSQIYASIGSSASIARCRFTHSALILSAFPDAPGHGSTTITDSQFDSCQFGAIQFGGAPVPTNPCLIKNCTFTNNIGEAAIKNGPGYMIIADCTFANNTGTNGSGGGAVLHLAGHLTIVNSTFVHNTATLGAAVRGEDGTTTLLNCTFAYNQAQEGGALYLSDHGYSPDSGLHIANCLFWGNSAPSGPQIQDTGSVASQISNSLIQDFPGLTNTPDANGNFTADPLFVRAPFTNGLSDVGDLHLRFGSPAIDRGLDAALPPGVTTDLDGSPRFAGAHIDLGAYEYQNHSPISHDDIVSAVKNTILTIPVLLNDSDPENDPLTIQSTTPASHGTVAINSNGTISYHPTGNYLGADSFTYTVSDGHGGQSTATVYVNVALQTSVLVTNASCVGTGSVALYARLVQGTTATKTNLIAGQPLLFLVNGVPVGTGITDAYGKAYVNYLPVAPGSFPITVQFSGNGTYAPSVGTGTLTVSPSATEITLQPAGGQMGGGTTLRGRLSRTNGNQGLVGMSVTVSVDGTVVGTVTTGVDGFFTCPYSIPPDATTGAHNITASFGGTVLNSPSTGSATLTVAP